MENTTPSSPFAGRSGLFFAGLAVIVLLFGAALWWLTRSTWEALYKDAGEANQAAILATLGQWQLPYRIREGVIEVPDETVAAARMHLADAGVPGRGSVGFELFDQADYGMSEFSQKINYQRALEGELARTMMGTAEVQHARVHLTFKKGGLYRQAEEPAKASVVVRLRPDAVLDSQRVRGIQQLVASAVEGMSAERVVVLNENGQLLSNDDGSAVQPEHLRITVQLEQDLQHKAETLLTRSLGYNAAEVSVRVQLNFDRVKSVRELPMGGGEDTLQRSREVTSSESSSGSSDSKRRQSTRESDFMVGKERAEIEHAAGRIERISAGVVLAAPQSEAGLKQMRNLLEATLGLDMTRGDQLAIAYLPRSPAATAPPAAVTPAVQTTPAVVVDSEPAIVTQAETPWLRWAVSAGTGMLSVLLLSLWLSARKRARRSLAVAQPRLSSVEREQLLVDLRRWLAEVR
ncbi:flagellar M-ring protein FliF [Pseudomonas sp. LLC-1]|uniref:flagellar basal-body MS-ring/collar protein FliF n=1 Tax=Pseudomonas sp. LLC-1 TaxID=1812180 RepID=UPI000D0223E7|nr:flagellar basal-body MS-ring/collar protein FliF [Pseudomonas sp. LLC-1]PRN03001.1 flagellar M-ring protein FliF [Pseudomonas sp. LLC-1]